MVPELVPLPGHHLRTLAAQDTHLSLCDYTKLFYLQSSLQPPPRSPTEKATATSAQHLVIYKNNFISNILSVTCRRRITSPAVKGQGVLGDRQPRAGFSSPSHHSSKHPGTKEGSNGNFQRPRLPETVVPKEEISKLLFSPPNWRHKDTGHK